MTNKDRTSYFLSAAIIIVAAAVVPAIDVYGRKNRIQGPACILDDLRLNSMTIDRPEDAYRVWKQKGYRGRIVVALGRRLNFVQRDEALSGGAASFPVKVPDLVRTSEQGLRSNNYLLVAMQTGIARKVVSVVPNDVLQEKMATARSTEGASTSAGRIDAPYFGSPRAITALQFLRAPDEPVLLYINASFFRDHEPEDVLAQLGRIGIRTDLVVLCRSLDDDDVTESQRERLRRFGEMLGGGRGTN